uniref:Probable RuBisCO transcriptional regulator n=1 Tax=Cyanidiococcus yangmingshanensis TaxID=2690220 RepID=A0A7G5VUW6_9RHOD|nr:LysR transcriptional regulator [Cyanidiococcus yangmingshanensis]QMX77483.1 LysR transcriptional regulator [Cyanidiococcus yangmingshanensis]UNJ15701.1 LysR transcriptional regulator [Cyanidioschyzonaceae sp. 2]UNJ15918.1 LysR transcriptional regulator [Cyanidioschyzonaceae sp. 3]WDB00392.1 LysR transcriptional regulator [Cyanidiococcus yangmingshanensis]
MTDLPFTLDQLRIFKAIVVEGSFQKAAQSLYISQPAVSLQIQNLEKQLNTALFDRSHRKAKLTEAGQVLLKYATRILALCEETCRALEDLHHLQGGHLIIGASQTIGTYLMPGLIGLFRQKYPHICVQLQVHSTRRIAWSVAHGHIDVAVIGGAIPAELMPLLSIQAFAEDELTLIVPPDHPFAHLSKIQKEDLYRLRFVSLDRSSTIRKVIDQILHQNGIDTNRLKIEMELNSIESIKNAVQWGLGAAFVSVCAIAKELELNLVQEVKIEAISIKRQLYQITNPNRYQSKAATTFCQQMLNL